MCYMDRVLYCTVLYCTVLYCTELHCTALYCTVLYWTALYCTVLHCTLLHCTALYSTALHCTALYCTALHCTVLHCIKHRQYTGVNMFYGPSTAQYWTVLYNTPTLHWSLYVIWTVYCTVLHFTSLYCSVLYFSVHYNTPTVHEVIIRSRNFSFNFLSKYFHWPTQQCNSQLYLICGDAVYIYCIAFASMLQHDAPNTL